MVEKDFVTFSKGQASNLPTTKKIGNFYVTTDESGIFIDINDTTRIRVDNFAEYSTLDALEAANLKNKNNILFYITDENCLYKWNGNEYSKLGNDIYQTAVDNGYTGTEAEFYAALVSLQNAPFMPEIPKNITLIDQGPLVPYIKFGTSGALRYEYSTNTLACVPADQAEDVSPDLLQFACGTPTNNYHAANKTYVDEKVNQITAVAASKLATARAIDGVNFDGSAAITHYGTCATSASTQTKTVSLTGFTLVTGARVAVKFTYANTHSTPMLNVNNTGAKYINKYGTTAVDINSWVAGAVVEFVYDGSYWQMVSNCAPQYQYSTADLTAGTSVLTTGTLYFVYE